MTETSQTTSAPQILFAERVDSTNKALREKLQAGELSRGVLWAHEQTAGRGRLGRSWLSPEGGLYYSVATPAGEGSPPLLGFAACLATHGYLQEQGVEGIAIKWPNDLVYCGPDGSEAKLGGMLSEYILEGVDVPHVIVGLGINVNTTISLPPAAVAEGPSSPLPPSSLRTITDRDWDLAQLAEALTPRIFQEFEGLLATDKAQREAAEASLHQRWSEACCTLGRRVRIETVGQLCEGQAEAIEPSFALRVRIAQDATQIVQAGDCIHLRGAR